MKCLVILLVSKLFHNISMLINTFMLIIFVISWNYRLRPFNLFLNHWIKSKVSVKVNNYSFFAELATISFHITLCCYSIPATVFTTLLHTSRDQQIYQEDRPENDDFDQAKYILLKDKQKQQDHIKLSIEELIDIIVVYLSKCPHAKNCQGRFFSENFEVLPILVLVCNILDVIFLLQATQTEQFVKLLEAAVIGETLPITLMLLQSDKCLESEEARSVDQNGSWQNGDDQELDEIVCEDDFVLAISWFLVSFMVQSKVRQILLIELVVAEVQLAKCNHSSVEKYQNRDNQEVRDLDKAHDINPMSHKRILFDLILATVKFFFILNNLLLLDIQLYILDISY